MDWVDLVEIQDLPLPLCAGKMACTGYEPEGREFESPRARHFPHFLNENLSSPPHSPARPNFFIHDSFFEPMSCNM
jgi:hypothetical protein